MAGNWGEPERMWDEYDWERFLQQQDGKTEKYMQLLETYLDDPRRDEIIAREMGWTQLLDAKDWSAEIDALLDESTAEEDEPDVNPTDADVAVGWFQQRGQDADQGRLARAVGAQKSIRLSGRDGKGYGVVCDKVAELFGQIVHLDGGDHEGNLFYPVILSGAKDLPPSIGSRFFVASLLRMARTLAANHQSVPNCVPLPR